MNNCVLDSSALLAYLVDEPGANKVEAYLENGVCMSTVNWAEIISKASDLGQSVDELDAIFKERGLIGGTIEFFPLTLSDAQLIGKLRPTTRAAGLSIGDRACLALALRLKLPVLTADRSWSRVKLGLEIIAIR